MKYYIRVGVIIILLNLSYSPSTALGQHLFFMENEMIGKPVPDFTLKTLKEDKVNLAEYRKGKKTIIFFWATWCPHCREAMGKLNENSKELIKKDIKLVLIDQGEREKIVKNYIQKNNIEFDIFLDEEMSLMEPYGLIGVPTFFFINEEGIVKDVKHILPENYQDIFLES